MPLFCVLSSDLPDQSDHYFYCEQNSENGENERHIVHPSLAFSVEYLRLFGVNIQYRLVAYAHFSLYQSHFIGKNGVFLSAEAVGVFVEIHRDEPFGNTVIVHFLLFHLCDRSLDLCGAGFRKADIVSNGMNSQMNKHHRYHKSEDEFDDMRFLFSFSFHCS